jgi:hypothetical protein
MVSQLLIVRQKRCLSFQSPSSTAISPKASALTGPATCLPAYRGPTAWEWPRMIFQVLQPPLGMDCSQAVRTRGTSSQGFKDIFEIKTSSARSNTNKVLVTKSRGLRSTQCPDRLSCNRGLSILNRRVANRVPQ